MKNIRAMLGLNHEGRYSDRAESAANQVKLQQQQLVTRLRITVANINESIHRITDVGPETTDSLRPVDRGFNPSTFVGNLHEQSVQLRNATIELEIAEKNYADMFGEGMPEVGGEVGGE